jgi:hypothetical protein
MFLRNTLIRDSLVVKKGDVAKRKL